MKLKPIFVDEQSGEGLYAVHYSEEELNEFERLFELWNDTEYVTNYCILNQSYFETPHFENISIDEAITKIIGEAQELEFLLEDYAEQGFSNCGNNLQMLFKPLFNQQYSLPKHQLTKAKIDNKRNFPKPILRIYGIRLGINTFVITGGAIKLTKNMDGHDDTKKELTRLEDVKLFLRDNEIDIDDDLNYYYEKS